MKVLLHDLYIKHVHPFAFLILLVINLALAAITFFEVDTQRTLLNASTADLILLPGFLFVIGIMLVTQIIWAGFLLTEELTYIFKILMHITAAGASTLAYVYIVNAIIMLYKKIQSRLAKRV